MKLDHQLRIACLMIWSDLNEDSEIHNRIANELWCLLNEVDTTALSDITLHDLSTKAIKSMVLLHPSRSTDEHAAYILATMKELVS